MRVCSEERKEVSGSRKFSLLFFFFFFQNRLTRRLGSFLVELLQVHFSLSGKSASVVRAFSFPKIGKAFVFRQAPLVGVFWDTSVFSHE